MKLRQIPWDGQRIERSFAYVRRLQAENARLTEICEKSQDMAARYDLLLREGDHRIKNSLQVVASLLTLQARRETNASAREALLAAASRIVAVARIHDELQLQGSNDIVDLGALIQTMCESLHAMAGVPTSTKIVVEAASVLAPIALAQPMVLAVNELVINALRHAFPHGRGGQISVIVQATHQDLSIFVSDDGVGLPSNYTSGHGYGLTLVRAMIKKVGGHFEAQDSAGTRFSLSAPLAMYAVAT